jgi:hypothetical protein
MADARFECEGCNSWQKSHEKYKEMLLFRDFGSQALKSLKKKTVKKLSTASSFRPALAR